MKNVRYKISILIALGMAVLFAALIIAFHIYFDRYYINEAGKAIQQELTYFQNASLYSDSDDSDYVYEEYVPLLFSSDISYLFIYDEEENEIYNSRMERNFIQYIKNTGYDLNTIKEYRTDDVFNIYACTLDQSYSDSPLFIVYINIYPLIKITYDATILFSIIGFILTLIVTWIGWSLGKKIDDSERLQKEFFQNASHELKTPLMSIQGYAEGIQLGILDAKPSADIIMEETDRMTILVKDLLSLSKIDAGQMKLKMGKADIIETLYDCLRTFDSLFQKKQIEAVLDFEKDSLILSCDEAALHTVFENVLSNSLRYAQHKLYLHCSETEKEILIRIADDGKGIDEATLKHIFERFYTGQGGNSGIGLALSQEIIKLHKGKLLAYNEKKDGQTTGAVFEIHLPKIDYPGTQ